MTGRPSKFDKQLCLDICEDMAAGKSLRQACEDRGVAHTTVLGHFLDNTEGVFEHYARARKIQAELMYDEMMEIADDGSNDYMERLNKDGHHIGWQENGEWVSRSRLRLDARKWTLARIQPKRFGDRLHQEVTGADGGPFQAKIIELHADPGNAPAEEPDAG